MTYATHREVVRCRCKNCARQCEIVTWSCGCIRVTELSPRKPMNDLCENFRARAQHCGKPHGDNIASIERAAIKKQAQKTEATF